MQDPIVNIVSQEEITTHIKETLFQPLSNYFTVMLEQIKLRDKRIAELEERIVELIDRKGSK